MRSNDKDPSCRLVACTLPFPPLTPPYKGGEQERCLTVNMGNSVFITNPLQTI